ncbi:MAG: hypothetical protein WC564_02995 [Patescibacteria group bacterium]
MPSNLNNQPVENKKPWYRLSLDFHLGKMKLNKKIGPVVSRKKNIKDIRSRSVSDGTDGIGVENPGVLDIDLIKDEVPVIFDKKKHFYTLGAFIILSLFLVFEVYFFLYTWERQEISKKSVALQEEVTRLDQEIAYFQKQAAPAIEFKKQIISATPLFVSHTYWNNLFSFLERNTLVDVYYSGFVGDTSGSYLLHSWVKDFRAISFQLKTILADSHTANAKISNEKVNGGDQSLGVMFDLGLSVKPSIFTE